MENEIAAGSMTISPDLRGRNSRLLIIHETEDFRIVIGCSPDHAKTLVREMEASVGSFLLTGETTDGTVVIEVETEHLPNVIRIMKNCLAVISEYT